MPDMCAGRYVTGVLQGPCEAWKVTVFIAASALWLHFSARCDPHVQGDAKLVHLPPYGMRTGRPGGASLRRPTRGCYPVRAGRPGGASPCKKRPKTGANLKNTLLSSLNRELKSGCCLDSRGSVSGFSLILFQNPDKTTASASRYGTRESRYGSRAESR